MLALVREITTLDEFRAPTPAFQDVGGSTFVTFDPRIGEWLGGALIRGLLGYARAGDRPSFDIPTSLREHWNL